MLTEIRRSGFPALSPTNPDLRGRICICTDERGPSPLLPPGSWRKENPFSITFSDGQAEVMPVSAEEE